MAARGEVVRRRGHIQTKMCASPLNCPRIGTSTFMLFYPQSVRQASGTLKSHADLKGTHRGWDDNCIPSQWFQND